MIDLPDTFDGAHEEFSRAVQRLQREPSSDAVDGVFHTARFAFLYAVACGETALQTLLPLMTSSRDNVARVVNGFSPHAGYHEHARYIVTRMEDYHRLLSIFEREGWNGFSREVQEESKQSRVETAA